MNVASKHCPFSLWICAVSGKVKVSDGIGMLRPLPLSDILALPSNPASSVTGTPSATFVNALAVIGTDVYAGGDFATAGGVTVNRIAKWNGST